MIFKRTTARVLLVLGVVLCQSVSEATVSAAAQRESTVEVIPLNRTVIVECAGAGSGSTILLEGRLRTSSTTIANNAGDHLVRTAFTPLGVRGVGSDGVVYRGAGTTSSISITVPSGTRTTSINNFLVLGRGDGNNLVIRTVLSYVIGLDGSVQIFVDRFSVGCS